MEHPVTITLDRAQVAEWRVAKAMASRDTGQSLTWGDFFDMLVGSYYEQKHPHNSDRCGPASRKSQIADIR